MKKFTLNFLIFMNYGLFQSAVFADSDSIQPKHSIEDKTNQPNQFDEADATFGKRSKIQVPKSGEGKNTGVVYKKQKRAYTVDHRQTDTKKPKNTNSANRNDHRKTKSKSTTTDHRKTKSKANTTDHRKSATSSNTTDHRKKSKEKNSSPKPTLLSAPTDVHLYDIKNNRLTISWVDNSNNEYGVSVERGIPERDRGGINYNWQHVFNVQERIDSNIKGTGWRTDGDDGLESETKYCYRLRAYHQKQFSGYSDAVCVNTK